jgi:diguanylate cyclase (GGDEF)-like protein/PAS domain S-box-containing protein
LSDSVGVPVIVFSHRDETVTAINAILRQAGYPVHCTRIEQLNELEKLLFQTPPELLILFDDERESVLAPISEQLARLNPVPPLLLACENVTEQSIADAMEWGARDVISLAHENRFKAVVDRELQAYRMQVALGGLMYSANQYKEELRTLVEGSAEAIADVQEGIVVAANPTWVELFGYSTEDDLIALPFMDLCDEVDQPRIKGALVACLRQKWDDTTLKIKIRRADHSIAPIEINLERVTIDGESGVRVVVPGNQGQQGSPVELLEKAVHTDPATGFYHRHFFLEKVGERMETPLGGGVRAIAYIRPDNFAKVHNDIGMLATDAVLTQLAEHLKDFMQPADLYGRFGGTIFVTLLERGTLADAEAWAEQVRVAIEDCTFEVNGRSTSLTMTIALSDIGTDEKSLTELFSEVENTCRTGRRAGGNRVELSQDTTETRIIKQKEAAWIPKIRGALMNNGLRLVHQPISSMNEEVDGLLDTRVQMINEDGSAILAGEFVPAAERAGMIKNIDRWVIDASFAFCLETKPTLVFIRLSEDSIKDDSLPEWLELHLNRKQNNPSQICFQVSENIVRKNLERTKKLAANLGKLGFQFAVDHVGGAKNSADKILNELPMQFVKIDGSLMQGLHRNTEAQETVREISNLAATRGIRTIAERVEDANTMAILWQIGISFIQGNYVQMRDVVLEDTQTSRGLALM